MPICIISPAYEIRISIYLFPTATEIPLPPRIWSGITNTILTRQPDTSSPACCTMSETMPHPPCKVFQCDTRSTLVGGILSLWTLVDLPHLHLRRGWSCWWWRLRASPKRKKCSPDTSSSPQYHIDEPVNAKDEVLEADKYTCHERHDKNGRWPCFPSNSEKKHHNCACGYEHAQCRQAAGETEEEISAVNIKCETLLKSLFSCSDGSAREKD